ncbi:glycosyltransferase family 2 protein [Candidatus Chloroploca sp. Khr17]|uniref:glycosyltransferase family 2 protein n=1 Tax=Candidatus Chloroploca sp. Khr17 TaxID=2496869 RepID=UPI0013ED9F17|nr:glycosyltransferase family 2 protein [Candidatus Chloroploca sp. Khr17]
MTVVSILIVTHNSGREIGACLDALQRHTRLDHEVILVDNASGDTSLEIAKQCAGVRLLANMENIGFAAAVNQAARLAQGRYLLLLNPDTRVHEQAVDRLASYLDNRPAVGLCAPRVLAPDGRIRHNCFAFETPWSFFWFGVGVGPLRHLRNWMLRRNRWDIAAATPQQVEAVTGAAMLVRRDLFEQLGGLDERFFMYCEDGDFCLRARRAGWQTLLVPDAVVTHIGGASAPLDAPLLNGMLGEHLLRSRYRYTCKYWGHRTAWLLRWAYAVIGALCWLGGHVPLTGTTGAKLKAHGRLLWVTPILRTALDRTQADKPQPTQKR